MMYTEFNTTTGRMGGVHFYSLPDLEFIRAQMFNPDMDDLVEGSWDGATYYILDGEVTERPASPVTRSGLTLSDVPEGSTLYINGEGYAVEGEVELDFPLPGTYQLRVECFPYLDWTDEVTVPVVSGVEP